MRKLLKTAVIINTALFVFNIISGGFGLALYNAITLCTCLWALLVQPVEGIDGNR